MLVILTGTSFAGKTTMQDMLFNLKEIAGKKVKLFKTCTTRKMRWYEKDNPDIPYHFLTEEDFLKAIKAKKFFEYVKIEKGDHADFYGSLLSDLSNAVNSDDVHIAVFEPEGAFKIKKDFPQTAVVFIKPPSIAELLRRAEARNTESIADVRARVERAENIELKYEDAFDFKVINSDKEQCFNDIKNYLNTIIKKRKDDFIMKKTMTNFETMIKAGMVGVKSAEDIDVSNVEVPVSTTVDATTEGALGVNKVSVNGQTYTVNPDWTYAQLQNTFANSPQLGITIPNSGTIQTGEDGVRTLVFNTQSSMPQNYGTKGAENDIDVSAMEVPTPVTVDTTTEGSLGVNKVSVNGQTYTVNPDWTYAQLQNTFANSPQLGITIPNSGTIQVSDDGVRTLVFNTQSSMPQNYGTKGAEDIDVSTVEVPTPVTVDTTTEGSLGVNKVSVNGQTYTVNPDWTYAQLQNTFANSPQLGITIPNSGTIQVSDDGVRTLVFNTQSSMPQNYGTKGDN